MSEQQAEKDAARQVAAFYAAKEQIADLVPYIGPVDILDRFLAGEVVTKSDMLLDQSLFTVRAVLPEQMRRLRWMLDHAAAGLEKP